MHKFREYLADAGRLAKEGKLATDEMPLRVVIGNTSCDMDSAVGALVLGYYYTLTTDSLWIPVLNCHRADFFSKMEIVRHLKNCKIDQEELLFLNELEAKYPKREQISQIALVDHNQLDPSQEEWLGKNVSYVVDHHVDAGVYGDTLKEKECRFIGSACSLVALMLKKKRHLFEADLAKSDEPNLAYLLAAAVVLDSYNFLEEIRDKKWNADDIVAHDFLKESAEVGHAYWKELNDIKFDTNAALDMGLRAMFVRDYKKYALKKGLMGIAVVTAQITDMIERFGKEELVSKSVGVLKDHNLGIFGIIGIHADDEGHVEKSLLLLIDKSKPNELAATYEELKNHVEGLDEIKLNSPVTDSLGDVHYTYYRIGNTAYTRKSFEAVVKKFYH